MLVLRILDLHHQRLVLSCIFLCDFILNVIMFLFIMFLVYSSSTFDMVMIGNEFMYMFAKHLALFLGGLGGRFHVSMVLRCRLPTNAPYWLGHVVDHGNDSSIESFVFHPPLIGQVEPQLRRKSCYVLAFYSNVPYTYMKTFVLYMIV